MKTRRILSTILAIVFVLSTLTFSTVAVNAAGNVIYLDGANGSDSNNGLTADAAVKTLATAFNKAGENGTVCIIGTFTAPTGNLPAALGEITITGYDSSAKLTNNASQGSLFKSDVRFENISIAPGTYGYFTTNGYDITFGEGSSYSGQLHVGPTANGGATVASQRFVIDGGMKFTGTGSMGGGYGSGNRTNITGNLNIEVINGTLETLKLSQDSYGSNFTPVHVGGNINVFVGAKGVINKITNSGTHTTPKGSLNFLVEEGGKVNADILASISGFNPKEFYWVNIPSDLNVESGSVGFSSAAGCVAIECDEGYVAEIMFPDGSYDYAPAGDYKLPANQKVTVTQFRDDIYIAEESVDIEILPATPGESEWPVAVSNNEQFAIEAATKNSDGVADDEVQHYEQYTYDVTLKTINSHVFPADFSFTINGLEEYSKNNIRGYRITNYKKTIDTITFTYVADFTAAPEGMYKVSYDGGSNDAYVLGTVPATAFYAEGAEFTVASADVYGLLGYSYTKYTDGVNEYAPEDVYVVGTEDVVLTPVWEEDTVYTVKFLGDGATAGYAPDDIVSLENGYVTIPENTYSKIGYKFVEWEDEEGNTYLPGDFCDIMDLYKASGEREDCIIALTAVWEVNTLAGTTIYVDKATGNPDNSGATKLEPVDTIRNVIAGLEEGANATIVVVNEADLIGDLGLSKTVDNLGHITITGESRDSVINVNGYILLGSDTTIENVKINAKAGTYIVTNGYKAVIGPNLENVEGSALLDIIDGHGYGGTVSGIDTTINAGVKLGSYYLGGLNLSDSSEGVDGNVMLTVKGAEIETIDLSPKGGTQATFNGYIVANIFDSKIGTLKSSLKHLSDSNRSHVTMLFFNDGSMPELDSNLITNLSARNNKVFIIDSGLGGVSESVIPPSFVGKAMANATNPDDSVYVYDLLNEEFAVLASGTQDFPVYNINTGDGVNRIRFGEPIKYSDVIEGTIGNPVGGAQGDTVRVSSTYDKAKVIVESFTPDITVTDDKFAYDTLYTANINIVPNSGYFFDEFYLVPSVIISGQGVDVTLDNDGTLRGSYYFEEATGTAPVLEKPITFELGGATGTVPTIANDGYAEVLSTITLPAANTMSNAGYKFTGWREYVDGDKGELYGQLSNYSVPKLAEIKFVAEWAKRTAWEVPTVLVLYDLTIYATDKGRNPEYKKTDAPIVVEKAFANLEHEINGTKSTKTTKFDYEENVTIVASDGGANPIKINNWSLDKTNANAGDYKYLTIVYYYQTETAAAAGTKGWLNVGNFKLEDGSTSKWVGKGVDSINTVVANKWAAVTFDFTQAISEAGLADSAIYRQLQICPIGNKPCSELKGDTVYLKSMTFSKELPIVD